MYKCWTEVQFTQPEVALGMSYSALGQATALCTGMARFGHVPNLAA